MKNLNVGWLRDNIGLVSQEPALFATTVSENIRFGQEVSEKEITQAAKAANAHNFILKFPNVCSFLSLLYLFYIQVQHQIFFFCINPPQKYQAPIFKYTSQNESPLFQVLG